MMTVEGRGVAWISIDGRRNVINHGLLEEVPYAGRYLQMAEIRKQLAIESAPKEMTGTLKRNLFGHLETHPLHRETPLDEIPSTANHNSWLQDVFTRTERTILRGNVFHEGVN
jgi:hypothetical protein